MNRTKRLGVMVLAAALLWPAPSARAGVTTDILKEVLEEELHASAESFTDPEKVAQYLERAAAGDAEAILSDAFGNLSPDNVALSFLKKVMPHLTGPIGALTLASEVAHSGTEYFIQWARDNKMEEFYRAVLTAEESKIMVVRYNEFMSNWISGGGFYTDRAGGGLEQEMHKQFLHRLVDLRKKESYDQAKKKVRDDTLATFRTARQQAEKKSHWAVQLLEAAGVQPTPKGVVRMIKEGSYAAEIKKKGVDRIVRPTVASEPDKTNTKTTAAKATPTDQRPPGPPPSAASLTAEQKALVAVIKVEQAPPDAPVEPDFSPLLSAAEEAVNKLFASEMPGRECRDTLKTVRDSGSALSKQFADRVGRLEPEERKRMEALLKSRQASFAAQMDRLDGTVSSRARETVDVLKEILKPFQEAKRPSAYYKVVIEEGENNLAKIPSWFGESDLFRRFSPTARKIIAEESARTSYAEQKTFIPLEEMKAAREGILQGINVINDHIQFLQAQSGPFKEALEAYEGTLDSVKKAYAAAYLKNQSLAEYVGARLPRFEEEEQAASDGRELLSAKGRSSPAVLGELLRKRNMAARESAEVKRQIETNEIIIAAFRLAVEEGGPLTQCSVENKEPGGQITSRYLKAILEKHVLPHDARLKRALYWYGSPGQRLEGRPALVYRENINALGSGVEPGYQFSELRDDFFYKETVQSERDRLKTVEKEIQFVLDLKLDHRHEGLARHEKSLEVLRSKPDLLPSREYKDLEKTYRAKNLPVLEAIAGSSLMRIQGVGDDSSTDAWMRAAQGLEPLIRKKQMMEKRLGECEKREKEAVAFLTGSVGWSPDYDSRGNPLFPRRLSEGLAKYALFWGTNMPNLPFSSPALVNANEAFRKAFDEKWDSAQKEAHARRVPLDNLTVQGRSFPDVGMREPVKFNQLDLVNGELVVEADVRPESKGVSGVMVSLDAGKTYPHAARVQSGKVVFRFKPEDHGLYWIRMKGASADGSVEPYPQAGNGAGVYFRNEKEALPLLRRLRAAGRNWNDVDGVLTLSPEDLDNGAVRFTGYAAGRIGVSFDRGGGPTRLQFSSDGGASWQDVPLFDGSALRSPWEHRWAPPSGESRVAFRLLNPDGGVSPSEDFPPLRIVYTAVPAADSASDTLNTLVQAFERKDVPGFMANVSPDFYGGEDLLRDQLRRFFDAVNTLRLFVVTDTSRVQGPRVVLDTHWERTLVGTASSQQARQSGNTTFVFDRATQKLLAMKRDNLFVSLSDSQDPLSGTGLGSAATSTTTTPTRPNLPKTRSTLPNEYSVGPVGSTYDFSQGRAADMGEDSDIYWNHDDAESVKDGLIAYEGAQDLGAKELDDVTTVPTAGY
ncbi:MAG: hypothetical protein HY548_04020, partial [Elusimicrobia bacterium]|nr:hypothetical protein [Elusimicrobiota bacterium]